MVLKYETEIASTTKHIALKDGRLFRVQQNRTLASGAFHRYLFKTSPAKISLLYNRTLLAYGAPFRIKTYVQPTITGNGTTIPIQNQNLGSSSIAGMSAFFTPTYSSIGTLASVDISAGGTTGSGSNVTDLGDTSSQINEFISPKDFSFIVEIENIDSATGEYVLTVVWEEIEE